MPKPQPLLFARHIEDRRRQFDQLLAEAGYDCLLIHSGRPEMRLFDDQHPPFRAHAPFVAWVPQPFNSDSLLEIRPGQKPILWFCQPRDFWHVSPEQPADWWADAFDIRIVDAATGWQDRLAQTCALAVIGRDRDLGPLPDRADLNPEALLRGMDEARTVKTEWERECLRQANLRAARAHLAAGQAFDSGASELEIHLAYLAAADQDQDHMPYNSIVGLNEHAAVLHYQHRAAVSPAKRYSFLIDAGADHLGYAADITRTWTRPEHTDFDDLIDAVERAQLTLCDEMRAGRDYVDLHRQAHHAIAAILEQAGLVRMSAADQVETGISGYFLPHGLGHFIGCQVHDVAGKISPDGKPLPPPDAFPFLRLTRTLAPGNVVTVEPGLYFISMLLNQLRQSRFTDVVDWAAIDALLPFGGIRIEDNVLVTEATPINFTREAFASLDKAGGHA